MIQQRKRYFSKIVETKVGCFVGCFFFLRKEKKSKQLSLRLRKRLASSTPLLQLWLLCALLSHLISPWEFPAPCVCTGVHSTHSAFASREFLSVILLLKTQSRPHKILARGRDGWG